MDEFIVPMVNCLAKPTEMISMMRNAGFGTAEVFGDFGGGRSSASSKVLAIHGMV